MLEICMIACKREEVALQLLSGSRGFSTQAKV